MLKYEDVLCLFPRTSGMKDDKILFLTVSSFANVAQPKGLYIPLFENSGSLQEAIGNGAIAAVWPETEPVPQYTPNQFPLFYAKDLLKGLEELMTNYFNDLSQLEEISETTNFIFQHNQLLIEKEASYDIAVMAERINRFKARQNKAGEE